LSIFFKTLNRTERQWLTPVILATQETEIRRMAVQSQPRQIVHKTLSRKNSSQKRTGGVAQGVGPEFKPQYHKKKKILKL
jgi:predicted P-loop ATPase